MVNDVLRVLKTLRRTITNNVALQARLKQKMERETSRQQTPVLWDLIKNLILVIGILLFLIGWVYLFYYFQSFGIALQNVHLDFFNYYIYGFSIILKPYSALITIAYFFIFAALQFTNYTAKTRLILITALLVSTFPVYYFVSIYYSKENIRGLLNGQTKSSPVYLSFKKEYLKSIVADTSSVEQVDINNQDTLRFNQLLLFMKDYRLKQFFESTTENYYFANANANGTTDLPIIVYIINKDKLNFSELFIDQQTILSNQKN